MNKNWQHVPKMRYEILYRMMVSPSWKDFILIGYKSTLSQKIDLISMIRMVQKPCKSDKISLGFDQFKVSKYRNHHIIPKDAHWNSVSNDGIHVSNGLHFDKLRINIISEDRSHFYDQNGQEFIQIRWNFISFWSVQSLKLYIILELFGSFLNNFGNILKAYEGILR